MTATVQKLRAAAPARQSTTPARSSIARAAQGKDKPDRPYEVRANKPMGLLLRVQPSGRRTFYVQVTRRKRVRIGPADVLTLKQAEERAKAVLLDPDGATTRTRGGITLRDYVDEHYEQDALAKTKTGAATVARVLAQWPTLLDRRMTDITASEVDKLRNKRRAEGAAPATINRDVYALAGAFTHWVRHAKAAKHPLKGMPALKVADDQAVRYLSSAEAKRLRKALADRDNEMVGQRASANAWRAARAYELMPTYGAYSDHLTPMVLLSLNLGLRQGELFSMAWEQIDLKVKTVTVLASHAKGNATRTVPLNAEALKVLQAIRPKVAAGLVFKSPVTGSEFDNVRKAWAEVTEAAKLPDLRWHDLRHDFASQLVMRGVPLFTVQKLLGHATPLMTQRYAKLAPDTLAEAVAKLGART